MRSARLKVPEDVPVGYYHCLSRVVDRRFILGEEERGAEDAGVGGRRTVYRAGSEGGCVRVALSRQVGAVWSDLTLSADLSAEEGFRFFCAWRQHSPNGRWWTEWKAEVAKHERA